MTSGPNPGVFDTRTKFEKLEYIKDRVLGKASEYRRSKLAELIRKTGMDQDKIYEHLRLQAAKY